MTSFGTLFATVVACFASGQFSTQCILPPTSTPVVMSSPGPIFSGEAIDVIVSAESYVVWDLTTNTVLKEKQAGKERPVASLSKLLTVLAARRMLDEDAYVEIPQEVLRAQRLGANIKLPAGQHARVVDLLAASLIPSANDAAVTLAIASKGSEEEFVRQANEFAKEFGARHTQVANATGLQGGVQFSTAHDIRQLMMRAYADPVLQPFLSAQKGTLVTQEGVTRSYLTTNKLLGTYLPVLAAKTGYTTAAKENLVLITQGKQGQKIGVVLLGSGNRFQDMKVLVEWIWRNYTW